MNDNMTAVYWKAYMMAIKSKAGGDFKGPGNYFFVASDANRSVPASRYITLATTNDFLYNEADVLLSPHEPVYTPGAGNTSYVDALLTRKPTAEEEKKAEALEEELAEAEEKYNDRKDAAEEHWNKHVKENPSTPDFYSWCRSNAKTFLSAQEKYSIASGKYINFLLEMNGGDYASWDSDNAKLMQAKEGRDLAPGITMACKPEQTLDVIEKIEKAKKAGKPIGAAVAEPTTGLNYRPQYNLDPTYRESMDKWAINFDKGGIEGSIELDFEHAKKTSWAEFGFKNIQGGGGVSFLGLFRVGARGGSHSDYRHVKVDEKKSSVKCKLSWKKMQFFNVTPGIWNIPQIRKKYKATKGLEEKYETLIRPVQFLCASGLTVTCTIGGEARHELEDAINKQVSAGGAASLRIGMFGFEAGASYSKGDGVQTSTCTWDKNTGTLTFNPTPTFGNSVLLGVRGQAVSV
ncbi:hypothetical protein PRK78_004603 [Emydomyces testavorans]|uniref:Uncharacterized protein n=1 Tax=Emydomyces testavorans TaxID=2070801 RepID=A0AAF0DIZ0_9EURO|nr:hypothetical protein PRK78_004603 [Emydomyces testavorans]